MNKNIALPCKKISCRKRIIPIAAAVFSVIFGAVLSVTAPCVVGLINYFAFLADTILITKRVPIMRAIEIGRTISQLGTKPAIM